MTTVTLNHTMSFRAKLFLAILCTTTLSALLVTLALYRSAGSQLQNFIQSQERERLGTLANELDFRLDQNAWERLREAPLARQWALRRAIANDADLRNVVAPSRRNPSDRRTALPGGLRWVSDSPPEAPNLIQHAVRIDGQPAGVLVMRSRTAWSSRAEQRFRQAQKRRAMIALAIALLTSAAVAALLARGLHRPIQQLVERCQGLASGKRNCPWQTQRGDEFGRLHCALAELDAQLQRAEQQQRQWLSDTAHELRTPLTVLQGELEALGDGVRAFSPQALASLQAEVAHLGHMVNTLHELSLAESQRLEINARPLELNAWLGAALARHRQALAQAGLSLELQSGEDATWIDADPHRLQQILDNLISNSLRYTQAPGTVSVRLVVQADSAAIAVCDTAPAPSSAQLPHLFDRFFRANAARGEGGSGLGLAIVRALVELQNGRVEAKRSDLGGLCVSVYFPVQSKNLRHGD